jgi:hypothetical protein
MAADTLIVGLLALLVGLAFTFYGYRLFLVLLPVWGFLVGFFFGANLAAVLFNATFLADPASWLAAIVVGVVFALLAYLYYWLSVVLLGASLGYSIGLGLAGWLGISGPTGVFVVGILVAVLFAISVIVLRLPKYLAIWITAFGGAFSAISGVAVLLGQIPLRALEKGALGAFSGDYQPTLWVVAGIALAVVGGIYQTMNTAQIEEVAYTQYRNPGMSYR